MPEERTRGHEEGLIDRDRLAGFSGLEADTIEVVLQVHVAGHAAGPPGIPAEARHLHAHDAPAAVLTGKTHDCPG